VLELKEICSSTDHHVRVLEMVDVPNLVEQDVIGPLKGGAEQLVNGGRNDNRGRGATIQLPKRHVVFGTEIPAAHKAALSRALVKLVSRIRYAPVPMRLVQRSSHCRCQGSFESVAESVSTAQVKRL
jgi:hypothetical protein